MRLVIDAETGPQWVTIAYIPVVKCTQETASRERARLRRVAILQRVLYVNMRSMISASRVGVSLPDPTTGRTLLAFPRVLVYVCDQPEERAILLIKAGACRLPCSNCNVNVDDAGSPSPLQSLERDPLTTLERQHKAAQCRRHPPNKRRALTLEAISSSTGAVSAPAGMAGISTAPHQLFKMIGFDILHVSCTFGQSRVLRVPREEKVTTA